MGFSPILEHYQKEIIVSYVRIWLHCVWGTKNRTKFLTDINKKPILIHIKDNAVDKDIYIDFINGHKDHIHCLMSLSSTQNISEVMQSIKGESSFWINKNHLTNTKFKWADEYYAVSISESQVNRVRSYIKNQDEHHRKKTWKEECEEFINKHNFRRM